MGGDQQRGSGTAPQRVIVYIIVLFKSGTLLFCWWARMASPVSLKGGKSCGLWLWLGLIGAHIKAW